MNLNKQYTLQQRIKIVEAYFATKSVVQTQRHSPDLNPPDFFLWGYLKERIYANNSQTLDALKTNIRRVVRNIPADMIARVIANFNVSVAAVILQRGAWIEHIINY